MKENILSIFLGAIISVFMSISGMEILNGLLFSFLGGFMGLVGNTLCKYVLQKLNRLFKSSMVRILRNRRKGK